MRPDKMTTKSQEAFREDVDQASRRGNPELVADDLLFAMLNQREGVASPLFQKAGGDVKELSSR